MQAIYIDVTNYYRVRFISGIQRVVKNILFQLNKNVNYKIILIVESQKGNFSIVDEIPFFDNRKELRECSLVRKIEICDMNPGDILFELDGVWNNSYRRSNVLPLIKNQGVRIITYIYDIIPILLPQYAKKETLFRFMNYITAELMFSDYIITSTKWTLDEVHKLQRQLGIAETPGNVSWLGTDIRIPDDSLVSQEVKELAKEKYLLYVGTIEPRKNHELVLDACEQKLFDKGINLIFAGRSGWNMEAFLERIQKSKYYGKQLFHLEGLDDADIDYLYRHAFFSVFPSKYEGFGLPIVESLGRGTPIVSSDIPVLKEVGEDWCEYINVNGQEELCKIITDYLDNSSKYEALKNKLLSYKIVSWEYCADRVIEAVNAVAGYEKYKVIESIKQMLLLSNRVDDFRWTLPFIKRFMPYIKEIVVCCPDNMVELYQSLSSEDVEIKTITDSELLQGESLPEDHSTRNFLLRCRAMKNEKLDSAFIMTDDDYRPLCTIESDFFVSDGRYNMYYCNDLSDWMGDSNKYSSFDCSMFKTLDFCMKQGFTHKMYASHMPQVIDRRLYLELLDTCKDIEYEGLDEWSTYFNYVCSKHPKLARNKKYVTLGWPGNASDWDVPFDMPSMVFENFYSQSYDGDNLFKNFSKVLYEDTEEENQNKRLLYLNELRCAQHWKDIFEKDNVKNYLYFGIRNVNGKIEIALPTKLVWRNQNFVRVDMEFLSITDDVYVQYVLLRDNGDSVFESEEYKYVYNNIRELKSLFLSFYGTDISGATEIRFLGKCRDMTFEKTIPFEIKQS